MASYIVEQVGKGAWEVSMSYGQADVVLLSALAFFGGLFLFAGVMIVWKSDKRDADRKSREEERFERLISAVSNLRKR